MKVCFIFKGIRGGGTELPGISPRCLCGILFVCFEGQGKLVKWGREEEKRGTEIVQSNDPLEGERDCKIQLGETPRIKDRPVLLKLCSDLSE